MKYILIAAILFLFSYNQSLAFTDTIPDFYQKIIDISPNEDFIRATVKTKDKGVVLVGDSQKEGISIEGFITKMDSTGTIEWSKIVGFQQTVPGFPLENWERFHQVIEMEDGSFIVGGQNVIQPGYKYHPFILKFSKDGDFLWCKEIVPPPTFETFALLLNLNIIGEEIFLFGSMQETWFQRSFIMKINENGNLIWGKQYFNGNAASFPSELLGLTPNKEMLFYYNILKRLPTEDILGVAVIDSIGNILSIKTYKNTFEGLGISASSNGTKKFIANGDSYLLSAWLGSGNTFDYQRKGALLKIDTFGNIQWAKTYSSNSSIIEGIDELFYAEGNRILVNFNDVYNYHLSFLNPEDPNEAIVLAEINTNGDLLWNKVIDAGEREDYTRMELMNDQSLLLSAKSNSFATQTQGEWAIHQIKTDPNLYFGDCTPTDSLDIIVEDLEIIQDTFFLESMPFENIQDVEIPVVDADINVIMLCPEGAANLTVREVFRLNPCESDSLKIKVRVCNTGYTATGQGVPLAIYDKDPTLESSSLLLAENLNVNLPPTVCRDINFSFPMPVSETLFFAINDDGTEATPYNPALVFGDSNFMDNDFLDNIQPFSITNYEAVFSQLDTSLCVGDTLFIGDISIAPGQSDTVFLQTFAGCDSILMVQTTEKLPAFTSETIDLCFGDSVLIFENYVHETGVYDATFTAFSGCDSVHQITVAVSEEIIPDFSIENEIGSNAMNGTIAIENIIGGTSPYFYNWNTGGTTAMIENLSQGNYFVTITDANDCEVVFEVVVDLEVSTSENTVSSFKIDVLPNPSASSKDIKLFVQTKRSRSISYEIIDAKGHRLVNKENIPILAGDTYLPIDFSFSAGVYFLKILENGAAIRFVVL